MKLIGNRILAEVIPTEAKTESGIILPEKLNLEKNRAEIVLTGPDVKYYKIGQVVKFNPHTATRLEVRNTDCVFLREDQDIIGVYGMD